MYNIGYDTGGDYLEEVCLLPVLLAGGVGSRLYPLSTRNKPKQFTDYLQREHMDGYLRSTKSDKSSTFSMAVYLALKYIKEAFADFKQVSVAPPVIICQSAHAGLCSEYITPEIEGLNEGWPFLVVEPSSHNTLAPLLVCSLLMEKWQKDSEGNGSKGDGNEFGAIAAGKRCIALTLPADQLFSGVKAFIQNLHGIICNSRSAVFDGITVFGFNPGCASPHHGYFKLQDEPNSEDVASADSHFEDKPCRQLLRVLPVREFVEKPSVCAAEKLIADGYLWNSGALLFSSSCVLEKARLVAPDSLSLCRSAMESARPGAESGLAYGGPSIILGDEYNSIDFASIEHTLLQKGNAAGAADVAGAAGDIAAGAVAAGAVAAGDAVFGVSLPVFCQDVGTYPAIKHVLGPGVDSNVVLGAGPVDLIGCGGNVIVNKTDMKLQCVGVRESVVCATEECITIMDLEEPQVEVPSSCCIGDCALWYVRRKWGWYGVYYSRYNSETREALKVKKLYFLPEGATSLQYHRLRSECMTVVSGEAVIEMSSKCAGEMDVTALENPFCDEKVILKSGESVIVPVMKLHRIINSSKDAPLVITEVQTGEATEEWDIVRL